MNRGATKFFGDIVTSTVWTLPYPHRVVWVTILSLSDDLGEVLASIPGLARTANVTIAETEAAILTFLQPDPLMPHRPDEGRRLQEVDGGWQIIGYARLRNEMRTYERREYLRRKQAERRAKAKAEGKPAEPRQHVSTNVLTTPGELDLGTEAAATEKPPKPMPTPPAPNKDGADFVDWFLLLLTNTGGRMPVLTDSVCSRWGHVYEQMIQIDKRTPAEIRDVCTWARNDNFWRSNFLSPMKLRDKKDGIQYFDIFMAKMQDAQYTRRKSTALA